MADINKLGFLVDRDVLRAAIFLPHKRTRTTVQMGLPEDASDETIVKLASERQWIIVTGNGDHFVKEILKFQKKMEKKVCRDLAGLIVLPNGFEIQKRVMQNIEEKLRFGNKRITFADVWEKNYCVRIPKNGRPTVSTFPKCFYCRKMQER